MTHYISDNPGGNAVESSAGPNDLLCRLIEAIGKHAVDDKEEELQRFQQRLAKESECLKGNAEQGQMRTAVDQVIDVMASHNEAIKADHRAHSNELSAAVRMMVETIGHVSKSSQAAVHQLSLIEKNLTEVTAGSDATRLRSKLGVCLKMIRDHSEILRVQSEERVTQLKTFVSSTAAGLQAVSMLDEPLDPVTGLPSRVFAENLIDERLSRGTDCLVGVITVDRFSGLQGRFGQAIVDDLIKIVASQLAQRLPEATALCRWSQNSFMAVTDIVSSYAETSQQWRKVRGLKIEKQIEDPGKTAFVVLNTSLMVEHLQATSSKRVFIQNADRFVSQNGGAMVA